MDWLKSLIDDQTQRDILIGIVFLIIGIVIEKIRKKTRKIEYHTIQNRLGLSASDPVFGNISILHNDTPVRNLWNATVELYNNTHEDFENIDIKVYTGADTLILSEKTEITDTSYIIKHTEEYDRSMIVSEGNQPAEYQISRFYSSKEYTIPVFNRFQTIKINLLCTRPNDELSPRIYMDTLTPGLKFKRVQNFIFSNGIIFGVPTRKTLPVGLITTAFLVFLISALFNKTIITSYVSWFLGLSGTLFGAFFYRIYDKARKLFIG